MIEAVVRKVFVHQDPVLPLHAAAQQPDEVRVLHFRDALDFSEEFLDPLLGFRGQNLRGKFSAVSQNPLSQKQAHLFQLKPCCSDLASCR